VESAERFSNRVENYVKYRPGYPAEMMAFFAGELGLTPDAAVADIGSGTGLSTRPFLENGNVVYGVEPNASMRAAAENYLREFPNFRSVDGTSENTNLESGSIGLIVAAQAFHWFRPEPTRTEFKRILKIGGYVALIWNERQLGTTPFLVEYEQLLLRFANDYEAVRHENVTEAVLGKFFGQDFERASFPNKQVLDLDGLRGRMLSASYMPAEDDARFPELEKELTALFAKHEREGKITILYDTNVFYTQL
jgi:SAM-dependent methyltransferase